MVCQPFVSSNIAFEELVMGRLKTSPLIKPFLTPRGWQKVKCVYWEASVGLKCMRTSRMDSFFNRLKIFENAHQDFDYDSGSD